MNKNTKSLILLLLPLIVGVSIGYLLSPKKDKAYEAELERQNKELEKQLVIVLEQKVELQVRMDSATQEIKFAREGLVLENEKTEFWKTKYEKAKNTPVSIVDQRELDQLLNKLYPE